MKPCECGCGSSAISRFIRGHNGRKVKQYEVDSTTGCWNWLLTTSRGHGQLSMDGKMISAHRFYYEKYKGVIPKGLQIDHLCRNRRCVNPDHLEVVTQEENIRRGALAKLSKQDVVSIKEQLSAGARQCDLARTYGVTPNCIWLIAHDLCWKGLDKDYALKS